MRREPNTPTGHWRWPLPTPAAAQYESASLHVQLTRRRASFTRVRENRTQWTQAAGMRAVCGGGYSEGTHLISAAWQPWH